ncbi:hypothetical protein QBC37DRAFT_405337 [Rhypophila decipiens]|uniref:Uncharacterized protein n=1 Tax=Rhypophila decipiens TaxID=261697 RepID=A0AAN6XXJ0_9PEZI|nr:hypothetical protein QBC37DRAFT_405337 [Rhypophila decipiens]
MAQRQPSILLMLVVVLAIVQKGVYGQTSRIADSAQAPTITSPPSPSRNLPSFPNSETCGFLKLFCDAGFTCTMESTYRVVVGPVRYAACCADEEQCNIFTTCYRSEDQRMGLGDTQALVCTGSRSRCRTYFWESKYATAYACASSEMTDVVDWVPSSTSSSSSTAFSTTRVGPVTILPSSTPTGDSGDSLGNPGPLTLGAKIGLGVGAGTKIFEHPIPQRPARNGIQTTSTDSICQNYQKRCPCKSCYIIGQPNQR